MMKIEILMKLIDERRKKAEKVLQTLRNATDYGQLKDTLNALRSQEVITDVEHKRLMIAHHDFHSYVKKVFQGIGIWI